MSNFFGNDPISSLKLGNIDVQAAYIGSQQVWSSGPQSFTLNYVYKLLNLIYINNIKNSIYNLDYDSLGVDSVRNQSYTYEVSEKMYSWF